MADTVALALVVTPAFGWLAENSYDERAASAAALAEADNALRDEMIELGFTPSSPAHAGAQRLSKTHRIEILSARSPFSLPLANGVVSGSPPSPAESAAIAIVVEELWRYPRAFVERARLSRVVLCSALKEADTPIPSLPNFHRTLLLDVDAGPAFLRRLIHHEVFHFLDYADDDQVQRDPEWEKLNDRWFVYGSGGRFERDPRSSERGSSKSTHTWAASPATPCMRWRPCSRPNSRSAPCPAIRTSTTADFVTALERAFRAPGPQLIEAVVPSSISGLKLRLLPHVLGSLQGLPAPLARVLKRKLAP